MQLLSTKRLTDALEAGFSRCEENGRALSFEQRADVMAAVFEAFADELIEELGRRG
jgi:hypothetical protein